MLRWRNVRAVTGQLGRRALTATPRYAPERFRSFSSKSNADGNDDEPGLMEYLQRCYSRWSDVERYDKAGVFAPSRGSMNNLMTYLVLQMPAQTQVDLVDFLEGARHACALQLKATNSRELADYVAGNIEQSSVAADLASWCTPGCWDSIREGVMGTRKKNIVIEMQDLQVQEVHVSHVHFDRVTSAQLVESQKEMVVDLPRPSVWNEDANVERMQITVRVKTEELLKMHIEGEKERSVKQMNVYRFRFDSPVTSPHQVDWRIGMVVRMSAKATVVVSDLENSSTTDVNAAPAPGAQETPNKPSSEVSERKQQ